MLEAPGRRTG